MNYNKKTIGMLVLVAAVITAAATIALPSMTQNAEAAECAGSWASVTGDSGGIVNSGPSCSVSVTATP